MMRKLFFLFLMTVGLIHLPVSAMCGEQGLIDVYPGWNFVSVPHKLSEGYDTGAIFSTVDTAGHSIWFYDASVAQYIRVTPSTQILPLNGIWIYSFSRTNIPLQFSQDFQLTTKQLYPGWNTVGYGGCTPNSANNTLFPIKDRWSKIIGYDSNTQIFETSIINQGTSAHSDGRLLFPTKGYWIYISDPCSISYYPDGDETLTANPGDDVFIHLTLWDEMGRPVLTTTEQLFITGSEKGDKVWLSGPISITVGTITNETIVPIPISWDDYEQAQFALFSSEFNQIAASLSGMKLGEEKIIRFEYPDQQIRTLSEEEFSIMGGNFSTVSDGDQLIFGFPIYMGGSIDPLSSALRTVYISSKNETSVSINYGLNEANFSILNFSNLQW